MSNTMVFVFNVTQTTEIYTLSLHDALPIYRPRSPPRTVATPLRRRPGAAVRIPSTASAPGIAPGGSRALHVVPPSRSEEHTSELQSRQYLACRPLLEKKTNRAPRLTAITSK